MFLNLADTDMSLFKSLRLFMGGVFMNAVTPLGQFGGEPFMAYIVSDNSDIPYESALATVLSTDILTFTPSLTFTFGSVSYLLLFSAVSEPVREAFGIAVFALLIGGPLVYLIWFKSGKLEAFIIRTLNKITSIIGRGGDRVDSIERRLQSMEQQFDRIGSSPTEIIKTAVLAHIGFFSHVLCLYYVLAAVGFDISIVYLCIILPLSNLAALSPTPGGSGTYEAAMSGLITAFTPVDFTVALTAAILFRLATYWPSLLIGYISFLSFS